MKSFAFIVNPATIKQLKDFRPALRLLPDFVIRSSLKNFFSCKSCKVSPIKKVQSIQKKEINGFFIVCPPEKILDGGHIAKRLGAKVIGLNGYASYIVDKDQNAITRELNIPVTNGNAFTAWSVFEAIYRVTKINNIELKKSNLAISEATNPIGSLCAKKLSDYVSSITIVSDQRDRLLELKEKILDLNHIEVIMENDVHRAVENADIVINTNNSPEIEFEIEDLKPNAIVCDISLSDNIFKKLKLRKDITFIRCGLVKLPYPVKLGINTGLPKGIILASLAETMLLTFEEKFVSYSLGDNINLDKLEEIADIAARYGFEVWIPEAPVM